MRPVGYTYMACVQCGAEHGMLPSVLNSWPGAHLPPLRIYLKPIPSSSSTAPLLLLLKRT
jgi:hypothetical protein